MQSTLIDVASHLQLCFAELSGHCVVVQADSKLIGGSMAPMTELVALFLLVEYGKLNIAYLF